MDDRTPSRDTLDPIERASIDELQALQLTRLQSSLRHAYDNVPHYRRAFEAAGVHPDDCKELADLGEFPHHQQIRSPGELSVRHVRRAQGTDLPDPRLVRNHRPTDRRRLHRGGYRHVVHRHGPLDPGRGRPTRRPGAHRLWIRPFHRRARRALRRRAVGLLGHPGLRRDDRTPGHPDQGLRTGFHHGHPVLHAVGHRRDGAAGHRPGENLFETGHLRCRTVDQ